MKKTVPYIIISLVLAAIIVLFILGKNKLGKRFDERITFHKKDKNPYGAYFAFNNLHYLFPNADIYTNKEEPGYWDSLSAHDSKQALIIIAPLFLPDEYEIEKLLQFVKNGNDVFISARYIGDDVEKLLNCKTSIFGNSSMLPVRRETDGDSLSLSLYNPPYPQYSTYSYPGFNYNAWAYEADTSISALLGGDDLKRTNFIHLKAGAGNLYLHLAPMAFSNYFLLHRNNIAYYEKVLSVISSDVKKIAWDEYFINKRRKNNEDHYSGWFSVLFRFPAMKAALLTAMLVLLLYVLMEMRRKQRIIPLLAKPRNDSLDFVKTIGRLYHDKGDHKNLCRKMSSHFLEYIRTRYKLLTNRLDDDFIMKLHVKSTLPETELKKIISFINNLKDEKTISAQQLVNFHKQLEIFYQNT